MSAFKDILRGRFWIGVAVALAAVVVVSGIGAAAITWEITPMDWMSGWGIAAWLIGGFMGTRFITKEKDGALVRALLLAVAAFLLAGLIGIAVQGNVGLKECGWQYGVALLAGTVSAAVMRPKKKRSAKARRRGREVRAKKR